MRLKKVEVAARPRLTAVVILGLLLAGALYYTLTVLRRPALVTRQVPVYGYTQAGNLDYSVQLKPNSIFPEKTLGPGKTYFTQLVQGMDAVFAYNFKADRAASLQATYSVTATVEAPKLWQKEFVLVPPTEALAEGDTLAINRAFSIDLAFFNNFLKAVNEELKTSASESRLVIKAPVSIRAVTSEGTVVDQLAPTMSIPLTTGSFQVGGTLSPKKNGALMVTQRVADPALGVKRKLAALPPGVIGLLLVSLLFFTTGKQAAGNRRRPDLLAKAYGDRMVRVHDDFLLPEDLLIVSLGSWADLVRVADELSKPVLYQPSSRQGRTCYLVIDGITAYLYLVAEQAGLESQATGVEPAPLPGTGRPVASS